MIENKEESSHFYRTVKVGSEYVHERVDMGTGEITPKRIRKTKDWSLPTKQAECEPFWTTQAYCVEERKARSAKVKASKTIENPYFGMLNNYAVFSIRGDGASIGQIVSSQHKELNEDELDNAIASLIAYMPHMDDYFEGVANLGTNNPLSKNVMFHLLRSLPEISSTTIYEATTYSVSYCQRLATALRVFIKLTT